MKDEQYLNIAENQWIAAYKDLTPSAFGLYLLLATRRQILEDNFYESANKMIGIKYSSFSAAVRLLKRKGYLVEIKGKLTFFISPIGVEEEDIKDIAEDAAEKTGVSSAAGVKTPDITIDATALQEGLLKNFYKDITTLPEFSLGNFTIKDGNWYEK